MVLPNLVLGETAFPEFLQEDCTPAKLADALAPLLDDSPARARPAGGAGQDPAAPAAADAARPSEAAADIVLRLRRERPRLAPAVGARARVIPD